MGILAFADKSEVTRYQDGDDWIDLRKTLTKGEMNSLFNSMPENIVRQAVASEVAEEGDEVEEIGMVVILREAPELSKALFSAYATAWSLKGKADLEHYNDLSVEAANWVDEQVMNHSQNVDTKVTSAEGKSPGKSPRASRKATPENES
jgi:hypothetical protein